MNNYLGKIDKFKVLRETDLGYVLTDGTDEFFLHRNETNFLKLKDGETVSAFIYSDKKSRVTATLHLPKVTVDKCGFAKVVDVNTTIGVFLNIGTSKDVLLSRDDLPTDFKQWPQIDDFIVVKLRPRGERLVAKMSTKDDILEVAKKVELPLNEKVHGYIYRMTDDGVNIVTDTFDIVFVYQTNLRKKYRLGEEVNVKIIQKNDDDYSGTLIENKEIIIHDDKQLILNYLKKNQGVMAITEKSDPAVISKVFSMSKSAFKKAIGSLYKDQIIVIQEDKIVLL